MLKLFGPKKKKKSNSAIDIMSQNNIDDILPTIPVAVPVPVKQPSPVLFMPKPRHVVPPTKDILQNHENDKTELEIPEEITEVDVSPIMLPHRVRFMSASAIHGNSPINKPSASPSINKRSSIAASSEDSHRVYESALESPALSSPHLVVQQQQQTNNSSCTSLEDVEALQQQVHIIQQICEQERQEWLKREHAHRLREKEMLEKITETQDQLRQALAQVQQQAQQQQQQQQQQLHQKHYRIHPPRDDSGYMEYEDDEQEDVIDDSSVYRYQQQQQQHYHQHAPLPRVRSMERPASRQHRSKRWLHRRSVSVEKPRAASEDYRRPHSRSRSRASSYYDDDDERDAYFIDEGEGDLEAELEDDMDDEWDDYYQQNSRMPPQPRPRISESIPTVRYLRPRRSYRRPRIQYHHPSSYYHHYYPYDLL